jgi:peptide/nickel transport system permease protein
VGTAYGLPTFLLAQLIAAVFGPGVFTSMVAIGIVRIPVFARLRRANFPVLRDRDFLTAAPRL